MGEESGKEGPLGAMEDGYVLGENKDGWVHLLPGRRIGTEMRSD